MDDVRVNAQAVTVKTDDDRDTREILKVDSVAHQSRDVITEDRDGAFVSYCFTEVTAEFIEL
jgi:hypothetical protein